jgi:hypothetical protein
MSSSSVIPPAPGRNSEDLTWLRNLPIRRTRMASLPPRVPNDLTHLDRLITLLGNRAKGPLTAQPKHELETLAGVYPDPQTATRWKTALKDLRKTRTPATPNDSQHRIVQLLIPDSSLSGGNTKGKGTARGGGDFCHQVRLFFGRLLPHKRQTPPASGAYAGPSGPFLPAPGKRRQRYRAVYPIVVVWARFVPACP